MNWLHLSDLHFNPSQDGFSTSLLRDKLKHFISDNNIKVDLIFLTGDYRHAVNKIDSNQEISRNVVNYIIEISNITGVSKNNIHYIPGNHDLNRFTTESDIKRLNEIMQGYLPDNGKLPAEDRAFLFDRFESFKDLRREFLDYGLEDTFEDIVHPYHCYEGLSILKLNTCLVCNSGDRNNLIVFMDEIYKSLKAIKRENEDNPIIILAHHTIDMFREDEKNALETLLKDYNIVLYLCGDAHTPWSRKVNNMLEITVGCLLYHEQVEPTFEIGGLIGNEFSICMYHWNNVSQEWVEHIDLNKKLNLELKVSNKLIHESMNIFEKDWFSRQNEQQILNLGKRYSPELNIELKVSKVFDGVMRNSNFRERFKNKTDEMLIALGYVRIERIDEIKRMINTEFYNINTSSNDKLNFDRIKTLSEEAIQLIDYELENIRKQENESNRYHLLKAYSELCEYIEYLDSQEILATNNPFVLLYGEGGIGKSHLIADIIKMNANQSSLLFLGQHFSDTSNPLNDIRKILDLEQIGISDLLSKLNRTAKFSKMRLVIFIDALNEGNGKEIWKNHLAGFVNEIKKHECLGLVISIRTEYKKHIFSNSPEYIKNFISVRHTGFSTAEHEAVLKYFDYYGLNYTDMPFANMGFENPLFLRTFCLGFAKKSVNWSNISIGDVYEKYLCEVNTEIVNRLGISNYRDVVNIAIKKIIQKIYNENNRSKLFDIGEMAQLFAELEKEEGVDSRLLDEMIATGLLTKSLISDKEYIHLTYEKMEDYLYAKHLVQELISVEKGEFSMKYKDLMEIQGVMQAFAIVLSEETDYEVFDIFSEPEGSDGLVTAFIYALRWRSASSITEYTIKLMNEKAYNYYYIEEVLDVLFELSTRENHPLNATGLVDYFKMYSMPERDATFIPLFDYLYKKGDSAINRIISWISASKNLEKCSNNTRHLASITLSLLLITPNNELRDNATRAMIKLLSNKIDDLIVVINTVSDLDDQYLLERLYAVAYGCVMSEDDSVQILKLGDFVYKKIFSDEFVYPNILLRDYAKNIVKYAQYKCDDSDLADLSVDPPYKSNFPAVPIDNEISKYYLDRTKASFKDYHFSQNNIIRSMQVEYDRNGRPGRYGDFGRYTFQSYFSGWKQLDYNDLKNIAIERIFDLGYDAEKHGEYDLSVGHGRENSNRHERIGKKYQWIAFYELAAQVADNYKLIIPTDEYGGQKEDYCLGAFNPSIRNFDPTISHLDHTIKEVNDIHDKLYCLPNISNEKWLQNLKDEIPIPKMIEIDWQGRKFVLLNGGYTWQEEKKLGEKKYEYPQKDMWYYINSYIVKKEQSENILSKLKDEDFMGRWLSDPSGSYQLYNKEYYWSDSFEFLNNPYYASFGWTSLGRNSGTEDINVIISTYEYRTERESDRLNVGRFPSWNKPCKEIFDGLEMEYGAGDSILYDHSGDIIAFDSLELLNEKIGFFIRKDLLSEYLKTQNHEIIWTCLAEKRVIQMPIHTHESLVFPSVSAVLTLGDENEVRLNSISEYQS